MTDTQNGGPLNEWHRKLMQTFGQRLKVAREVKYPSAEQFAYALALSPHRYRKYERGESEPNFATMTRICTLLDVTPNDLLPDAAGDKRPRRQKVAA
jgi:transcriptional regulator with XRE-family HTH domain